MYEPSTPLQKHLWHSILSKTYLWLQQIYQINAAPLYFHGDNVTWVYSDVPDADDVVYASPLGTAPNLIKRPATLTVSFGNLLAGYSFVDIWWNGDLDVDGSRIAIDDDYIALTTEDEIINVVTSTEAVVYGALQKAAELVASASLGQRGRLDAVEPMVDEGLDATVGAEDVGD